MPDKLKCLRCGYEWTPRIPRRPLRCPDCKASQWWRKAWEPKEKQEEAE